MIQSKTPGSRERVFYLDVLRVLAALAVIMVHSTSQNWHNVAYDSGAWQAMVCWNSLVRWPVPLFVMLTGILMLDPDREVSWKELYTRRIPRLVTAYLFWSGAYALYRYAQGSTLADALRQFINGRFHMYYIGVAIGLYMAVPVFRAFTREKKLMAYFLGICFLWSFLLPSAVSLLAAGGNGALAFLSARIQSLLDSSGFPLSGTYAFYFVFGLYLHKYPVSRKQYRWSLALGVLGMALRAGVLIWEGSRGSGSSTPYEFCIPDLWAVTALFLLGKHTLEGSPVPERLRRLLGTLSACTFGIYLSHMLVMDILRDFLRIDSLSIHPALSILPHSLAVFGLSLGLVFGMGKITFFKKYFL